eukprot:ctg_148.g113
MSCDPFRPLVAVVVAGEPGCVRCGVAGRHVRAAGHSHGPHVWHAAIFTAVTLVSGQTGYIFGGVLSVFAQVAVVAAGGRGVLAAAGAAQVVDRAHAAADGFAVIGLEHARRALGADGHGDAGDVVLFRVGVFGGHAGCGGGWMGVDAAQRRQRLVRVHVPVTRPERGLLFQFYHVPGAEQSQFLSALVGHPPRGVHPGLVFAPDRHDVPTADGIAGVGGTGARAAPERRSTAAAATACASDAATQLRPFGRDYRQSTGPPAVGVLAAEQIRLCGARQRVLAAAVAPRLSTTTSGVYGGAANAVRCVGRVGGQQASARLPKPVRRAVAGGFFPAAGDRTADAAGTVLRLSRPHY